MKIFIAYRFTGEKIENIKKRLDIISKTIKTCNHNCYSTILENDQFETEKWSGRAIMHKAFKEIDSSDIVLFFINSDKLSRGMILELGYSIARDKKLILLARDKIKDSIFHRHIDKIITYKTKKELINNLCSEIKKYN